MGLSLLTTERAREGRIIAIGGVNAMKIKPCHFCKSDDVAPVRDPSGYTFVRCSNCHARGPATWGYDALAKHQEQEAIDAWNLCGMAQLREEGFGQLWCVWFHRKHWCKTGNHRKWRNTVLPEMQCSKCGRVHDSEHPRKQE